MFSAFHLHFFVPVSGQLTSALPSALGGASPEETPLSCSQSAVFQLLQSSSSHLICASRRKPNLVKKLREPPQPVAGGTCGCPA